MNSKFRDYRITIIGNRGGTNIGGSFERAAASLGLEAQVIEPRTAMKAPVWIRHFNWYCRGHRPTWLDTFSKRAVESCLSNRSDIVVVTGIAAMSASAIRRLRYAGIEVVNYLTDDPWNPAHRASWFLGSLTEYSIIFSPRHANIGDLNNIGCPHVQYLPFAYDPELHFREEPSPAERSALSTDVLLVGGADADRIRLCRAIAGSGLSLSLYGDYWGRSEVTRAYWKGYADPSTLRKATVSAKACLCLTRRANRDGHTMRSYEVPAIGGVVLAEETEDHKIIFGKEGALYFADAIEMAEKAKWLVAHQSEARQMAREAHRRIVEGPNAYRDRLQTVLAAAKNG